MSGDAEAKHRYWPAELNARFAQPQFRGQGGMGRVWAAYDLAQQRRVAVKVLREDVGQYAESRERFRAEAFRMQHVAPHPNIIEIHDYGTVGDWCFLTMPLLSGPHIGQQHHPVPAALRIVQQTAAGLAHLHRHNLVHRDVKPSNLVFDGDTVRIVDFGIAKAIDVTPITKASVGTEGYIAPELLDHRNEVTPACDVYSLGCVLFKLLTGVLPHSARSEHTRRIPPGLKSLLDGMLAAEPKIRPTAQIVHDEIVSFQSETAAFTTQPEPFAGSDSRTQIVPAAPTSSKPILPVPTLVAPAAPAKPRPTGPVQEFVREWLTSRGHYGRAKVPANAQLVAVGAWLFLCLGGAWLLSLAFLLVLRMFGVGG